MNREFMAGYQKRKGICLDPRTKMALVLTVATVLLGSGNTGYMLVIRLILAVFPFLLLFGSVKWNRAFSVGGIYFLAVLSEILLAPMARGILHFLLIAVCGFLVRFMPGIMMGYYLFTTTKISEFMAAMEKMHVPEKITIPMSVMFRFFPTVTEEYASIQDAMGMRGILLGGKHPEKILEYRLVPLLSSCVRIGEELSAAALTRGMGAPWKRTNICRIGLHLQDILILLLCLAAMAAFVIYKIELV